MRGAWLLLVLAFSGCKKTVATTSTTPDASSSTPVTSAAPSGVALLSTNAQDPSSIAAAWNDAMTRTPGVLPETIDCAEDCASADHRCDYALRLEDTSSTSPSNLFGWVYIDPTSGTVWHEETTTAGSQWLSEAPTPEKWQARRVSSMAPPMNADEPNPYAPPAVTIETEVSEAPLPPGVRRFTLDPAAYDAFQRRMLGQILVIFALVVAVMMAILVAIGLPLDKVVLIFVLAVGWVAIARIIRVRMARRANLESYELLVGEGVARRNLAGFVSAEIVRREVDDVVEVPTGLWLRCTQPQRSLFVARAVQNWDEARALFETWRPITKVGGFAAWSFARREGKRQGPRDDPKSTLLGHGPAIVEIMELASLRSVSRTTGLAQPPSRTAALVRIAVVWFGLIFFFLAIWQLLSAPR